MSDFCYSWPVLHRVFAHAELLDRMTEKVGVRPVDAARVDQGMAWYEARTRCIDCFNERQCQRWLDRANSLATPPAFCPNAEFFRQCLKADAMVDPLPTLIADRSASNGPVTEPLLDAIGL